MKKKDAIALMFVLAFQSCAPNHDNVLDNYLGRNSYKVIETRKSTQDDAVNANSTLYVVQTTKTLTFIKESGEESYRTDTIMRTIVVNDNGSVYDK